MSFFDGFINFARRFFVKSNKYIVMNIERYDFTDTERCLTVEVDLDELKAKVVDASFLVGSMANYENGGDVADVSRCLGDVYRILKTIRKVRT